MSLLYPPQDPRQLEPWFSRHMHAMTAEGLHDKADIAEQLAARDQANEQLVHTLRTLIGERQPLGIDRPAYQSALTELAKWCHIPEQTAC